MSELFTTGNNSPRDEFQVGGGIPIWVEIGKELTGGFNPDLTKFPKGSVVQTGTPIKVNEATRTAEVHIAVSVYEAALADSTKVKVAKKRGGSVLSIGQTLMVAPSTLAGTGTGVAITAIDSSNPAYDELTLGATLGALAIDSVLVESDKAGSGAKIKVIPDALTRYDIYVDPSSTQFSCGAVIEGVIYDRRIYPVIKAIKDSFLGEITFSQSR